MIMYTTKASVRRSSLSSSDSKSSLPVRKMRPNTEAATRKIWMMTSDVRKIQQKLYEPQAENRKIAEAQLKVLEGKTEEAYALYKEAYYYSVVTFFNELENKNLKGTEAKEKAWEEGFNEIVSYYSGQISRLGNYKLPEEALYTYAQISARIGKL